MDRLDRAFIAALAAITTVYLFLFGYYLGATGLRVPVVDVIYWILHYLDHWLKGDWSGYLWLAHNGHRLVWSRLLMVAEPYAPQLQVFLDGMSRSERTQVRVTYIFGPDDGDLSYL